MIGHALSSQTAQPPLLAFACCNNNAAAIASSCTRRRLVRKWIPAALSMCASKSSLPSSSSPSTNVGASAMSAAQSYSFLNMISQSSPSVMSYSVGSGNSSSNSNSEECTLPPDTEDNFSRYSKFLVKNSNGVDGMGGQSSADETREPISWVDTLGEDSCTGLYPHETLDDADDDHNNNAPRPFSILSWNILAQSLYESQYQRRRITQVALSSSDTPHESQLQSLTSSSHPHPWPKRLKRIVEILAHAKSDIICLQECELQSFKNDLAPALSKLGYDGIAQEDDREDRPAMIKEATKHRTARNHILATFWKKAKFEPVGDVSVRTRTLTTVLRQRRNDDNNGDAEDKDEIKNNAAPNVAVINVHLEGHPRRFSERTHQLQHSMKDLAKAIEHERKNDLPPEVASKHKSKIGKLNALVLAGDFNCELQSSACSAYLRMGRLGKEAALGGIHGEDSIVLPDSLLASTEATQVIHPIMEWGRALPEDKIADVDPHPFRRNGMASAYPAWLGRDDARSHFTFCSELSKRPVPGLDQIWFTSMTLERTGLRRMFVDDSGLWERYFYDDIEVEKRREDERRRVLATGLPTLECKYPSDHLPIGATFDWKWDSCDDGCLIDDSSETDFSSVGPASAHCVDGGEVRKLNVVGSKGHNLQDDALRDKQERQSLDMISFDNPHDELEHLLSTCPYDSEEQKMAVRFILSPLEPPISLTSKEKPTPDQLEQLEARRNKKAEVLSDASLGVRPWLKNIWKVNKQVGKWDRQKMIEELKNQVEDEYAIIST